MGVASATLSQNHSEKILEVFNTFTLPGRPSLTGIIFESFWLELTRDGRFINDFKILKNSIGKKVCGSPWLGLSPLLTATF
jgi:hypothetical protein